MIEKTRTLPGRKIAMDMKLSPEQLKLRSAARELAEAEFAARAAEIDRTEAYPFDNVAALKAAASWAIRFRNPTAAGEEVTSRPP
jgi:alkylation response protein AidB-like acyl-CoA dehydrogenase